MASYAEWQKKIADARATGKAAREARDEAEMEKSVGPIMLEHPEYGLVRIENAEAHLPGHVIVRKPKKSEIERFRSIMWRDANGKGVTEAKAKAGGELVLSCLIYPEGPEYAALISENNGVIDAVAKECHRLSEAAAEAEEKA